MLIEVHMLKNYAASNLNRDDIGAPKTCMFGGAQRGRISSQCLKRSWRKSDLFAEAVGKENIGIRTRKFPKLVADELKEKGYCKDEKYLDHVMTAVSKIGKKNKDKKDSSGSKSSDSKKNATKQIIAFSLKDVDKVVEFFKEELTKCKKPEDIDKIEINDLKLDDTVSLDMALFGRMVTSNMFRNVDASIQVAHAFSTNKVMLESDYFTAVDDLINGNDENGAAMIDTTDYNSSCYYIYASLDIKKLEENLKSDGTSEEQVKELVQKTVPALIKTMVYSNPSGKQNSFAANALPSAILVECKEENIPVSLANAFEQPVHSDHQGGILAHSIERLMQEEQKIKKYYGLDAKKELWMTTEGQKFEDTSVQQCENFDEMLQMISKVIGE